MLTLGSNTYMTTEQTEALRLVIEIFISIFSIKNACRYVHNKVQTTIQSKNKHF